MVEMKVLLLAVLMALSWEMMRVVERVPKLVERTAGNLADQLDLA